MTIDEAIEQLKSENGYYANNGMTDVAEFNTKIIRWLEDYKRIKMLIPIEQALKAEYNKAIDDFKGKLVSAFNETDIKEYGFYPENVVRLVAGELKAGGENDNLQR